MNRIKIDIDQSASEDKAAKPLFSEHHEAPDGRGRWKFVKISGIVAAALVLIGGIAAVISWNYYKQSPQYALAELVQAARDNDDEAVARLVDTDAVIEDFLPQITEKAIELYGRGLPPDKIRQVSRVVVPIMPAVKERAKSELPALIREKTSAFDNIPFWAIVIGAGRYLNIEKNGDNAVLTSDRLSRPVKLTMRKGSSGWRVIGVEDEALAQRIAEKVGQEIIAIASKDGTGDVREAGKTLGIDNVDELLKQAESIFR